MEPEQQPAAGSQHPVELGEQAGQHRRRRVHDRPPGDGTPELPVRQLQTAHRAHVEPQLRVAAPGDVHHARRQVHAPDRETLRSQVRAHVPRPAPEIGDGLAAVAPYLLGERAEHRPSPHVLREGTLHALGIALGHGVVIGPGRCQSGGVRHTARP